MLGNGTLSYDHDRDGRATELGGCTALVRNAIYDTFLLIRYSRNRLTVRAVRETAPPVAEAWNCRLQKNTSFFLFPPTSPS